MPYIIVNDAVDPPRYFTGNGFTVETTIEDKQGAYVFPTLIAATVNGPLHHQAELQQNGWRVIPSD